MTSSSGAPEKVSLTLDEAQALSEAALVRNQTAPETARLVAKALVDAEADGQTGHGLARVAAYAAQAKSGKVDGFATSTVVRTQQSRFDVDARHGFAYPAMALARAEIAGAARETGIASAAIRNSHHCGVLGHQVEALADEGLVALMFANAPKSIAPTGGDGPLYGTNPIAFATPVEGRPPIVIDLALSRVARGKVMAASKTNSPIPPEWALDAHGEPTTDPHAALKGSMLPIGGAKGAALALMVEVFAGAMAGPNLSFESTDFFAAEGEPPALGQFMIAFAIDEAATAGVARILEAIAAQDGARPPGDRRIAAREASQREGLRVPRVLIDEIKALAAGAA